MFFWKDDKIHTAPAKIKICGIRMKTYNATLGPFFPGTSSTILFRSTVTWLTIDGIGLVIGFITYLKLVTTINYNTALITVTHTSLLSLLQPPTVVARLQSSNKGYSCHSCSLGTALRNRPLNTSLLRLPVCRPTRNLRTNSKLPLALLIKPLGGPHRKHFFLQLLYWCVRRSVTCSTVASLSAWSRTAWKTASRNCFIIESRHRCRGDDIIVQIIRY
jgi:hypothetical protein